jgi:hypothetical protein
MPKKWNLDDMSTHISQHSLKTRQSYFTRIRAQGYDASTGDVICPMCPEHCSFPDHGKFYLHFFKAHYHGPEFREIGALDSKSRSLDWKVIKDALKECTFVPPEVYQHRHTLLSLWPVFGYYPVWQDIKSHHP